MFAKTINIVHLQVKHRVDKAIKLLILELNYQNFYESANLQFSIISIIIALITVDDLIHPNEIILPRETIQFDN